MIVSEPPKDALELPFESIREGWSVYKTKDNVTVKLKLILFKLLLVDVTEQGVARLATGSNVIIAVTVPPSMKGTPSSPQPTKPEDFINAIVDPNVEYDMVKEDWNEYVTDGTKLGIKVVATVIAKTRLFDLSGDPIYWVTHQPIVRSVSTPEDKAKFLRLREKLPEKTV